MHVSFSNRERGCVSDMHLLSVNVNLSQIPQYSHNEVSVILVSKSSGDSLAQPVSYHSIVFHPILFSKMFCEISMYCITVLMITQKLNHTNSEFRI